MARSLRILCLMVAPAITVLGALPAEAQLFNPFEALFGPPRPPSNVPGGRQVPQGYPPSQDPRYPADPRYPVDQRYPDQRYPEPQYPDPAYPAQAARPGAPGVQSQPLAPPPGGTAAAIPDGPLPGMPRPPGMPQPADTSLRPGDEVVAEPPSQKVENKGALFSGLDKITGRIINFDASIGETVQFGALQVTPRACYTRPPTETPNTDAFIEVDEVTLQGEVKRIFTGWMFAASPGLHAVEHPIYDVWLTDCKNPVVAASAPPSEPPPVAQPAKPPAAAAPRRPTPPGPVIPRR
jgi:hypothetical protein